MAEIIAICPKSPEPGAASVRERMEALGWQLAVCEDTCESSWLKVDPETRRVVAYEGLGGKFASDLEACKRQSGYPEGRSQYA